MSLIRSQRSPPSVTPGLPAWLTFLAVASVFIMPGQALDLIGLGYGTSGGSAFGKVHPGTDIIVLTFALASARAGNPLRYFAEQSRRFPGSTALLAATALLLVYLVKVQQAPFTPLIDTFILPVFLFPLLVDMPAPAKANFERFLHAFFAFNALLGIFELMTGWRLIPVVIDGVAVTTEMEWRSAGLLGHPLTSAAEGGMYALTLALGMGRALPSWLRAPAIALQFTSLAAFGGRTALVLTAGCLLAILLYRFGELLRGRRFDRRKSAVMLLLAMIAIVGVASLIASGLFDQLLERFINDNGSAKSRSIIFDVLRQLSWQELWLGPNQDHVATVLHLEGIEVGVESFWLGLIVLCGMWMSSMFFVAFAAFLFDVHRRADLRSLVPLGFFLIFESTTIGLSTKSTSLAQYITMVLILMPALPRRAPAPVSPVARRWRLA